MQSPFKLLRKHQRWIMIGVALVAIVSFGLGDVITKMVRPGGNPGSEVVIESDAGNLTRVKLQELTRRRRLANAFMFKAIAAVNPQVPPQFLGRLAQQFGPESRSNIVFAWLLRHEGNRMGIVVDDETIGRYIDQETQNKLSTEQFRRIARELSLSDKEVYDILGDELLALDVYRLTVPITTNTPEQFWKFYQQLHTRQKIEVAALPVKDFVQQVDAPSESEIASLFEKNKSKFETSSEGEYKPGFRQYQKAQLHYLQIPYEGIEAQVLKNRPITDKDIEDYYETKKLIDRRFWEIEPPPATGDAAPLNPDFAPEEGDKKPQGPAIDPGTDSGKEKPAPNDRPESPAIPGDESLRDESPADAPRETEPKPEGSCGAPVLGEDDSKAEESSNQKAAEPAATSETPSADKDPDEKKPESGKPAATDEQPTPSAKEEKETDVEPSKTKPEIRAPKFKPLDDELREQIKEMILTDRATARIDEVTKAAAEALRDVGLQLAQRKDFNLTQLKSDQLQNLIEVSREEMQKIADKFGLKFGETGLVGPRELGELDGIGKAREKELNEFSPEGSRSILDLVFENDSICRVLEAVGGGEDAGDRYVFWKVQDVPSHVPKLDEAGVREQVVEAWKLLQAAPLAQKRAEALAESVRKADGKMTEALAGQTVTGDPKGAAITVESSPEFSWWRESLVPQAGMGRPPVQPGNPIVVTGARMKFMSYVFDDLKEGETGVVFNDDASICYVVRIVERRPADREQFKNAPVFSPFSPYTKLAEFDQQILGSEFFRQFMKRFGVKEMESAMADDQEMEE